MVANVLVTVVCITYNHEKYLRDALDGFLSQKTDFQYKIVIYDDASTDNTAAIIEEYGLKYPQIIVPIYQKENQYQKARCQGNSFGRSSFMMEHLPVFPMYHGVTV